MGILDNVERGLEKLVRGAFTTGTRSQVQPLEIASALRKELDNRSLVLAQGRTLAPNVFAARLSDSDFDLAQQWGSALAEELCDVVIAHVNSQQYSLQGPVRVSFEHDPELRAGVFEIDSSIEKQTAAPRSPGPAAPAPPRHQPTRYQPILKMDGQRYSINSGSIVLGRSSEADILVDDTGVSRRHLEIRAQGGRIYAVDLGSTNGSYVNGQRVVGQTELTDGSMITMGRSRLTFHLLPSQDGAGHR
ncbi:FhaA domain-containing protein [Arthrobacter sp. Ld5]|uniref:FhaA domain-containing protein n=1 Tax=Arthrobacter sp. Ld5 TaxID=649152 RepID=UPI003EB71579